MAVLDALRHWVSQSPSRRARRRRLMVELLEDRCVLTPVVSVLPIAPQQGMPFQGAVATFTDPANPNPVASNFSATINWGDGSGTDTTTPTVALVNGQFKVDGRHTYTAAGNDLLTVSVTDNVTNSAGNVWTTRASMPTARYSLAAAPGLDGQIYVFGGHTIGITPVSTVEAYNPATNSWTTKASMPTARSDLAATLGPDGLIYVFGGFSGGGFLSTVEAYNPATNGWTTKASMPTARGDLASALGPDGLIYVFGGFGGSSILSTVEAYNPATNSWTTKASMPAARDNLAAAPGPDGLLYVLGGHDSSGIMSTSTVQAYNPATDSWTTKTSMPTARNSLAAALGPDGLIYALGGFGDNGILSTVEAYNPATDSWTTTASMPTARDLLAAALGPNGLIYALGGLNSNSVDLSTVEAYLPASVAGIASRSISVSAASKPSPNPDRVGVFHGDGTWTLDVNGNGSNPVTFLFGEPGDQGIVGDWNGAGFDAVGTVRVSPNNFAADGKHATVVSLDYNGDRQFDSGDQTFLFGEEGDQIVLGDWNGDGKTKIGVVRPDGNGSLSWSLDFNGDHSWVVYHFGLPGDTALSGDWNGDGKDKIGVVRANTHVTLTDGSHPMVWSLDFAGTGVFSGPVYTFGTSNDGLLVGDWIADGKTKIGVAQAEANGIDADFILDLNGDGVANLSTERFPFGLVGDIFFRGDWAGNGKDSIGIARPSSGSTLTFALDSNGDHVFDAGDAALALPGQLSDTIFIGKWKP